MMFAQRKRLIFCLFLAWGGVLVLRLAHFMVFRRDEYLTRMQQESVTQGIVPALRGRILDRDGRLLAWSTRHLALVWRVGADRDKALAAHEKLLGLSLLPKGWSHEDTVSHLRREVRLVNEVAPDDIADCQAICTAVPSLEARSYFVRHRSSAEGTKAALGETTLVNGTEVGVAGLEERHDAVLRGRPGVYLVMRDKLGEWVPGTLRYVLDMRPGYDVYLPERHRGASAVPDPNTTPFGAGAGTVVGARGP